MNFGIRILFSLLLAFTFVFGGQKISAENIAVTSSYLSSCPPTIAPDYGDRSDASELKDSFAAHRHNISRHVRIRTRFKGPETGFRVNLYAPAWYENAREFISENPLLTSYQQPHYLSQQYAYLFRLTPF